MQDNENIEVKAGEEATILHYLIVILKHKKMITYVTLASAIITIGISLTMTPLFQAETNILPPQQSNTGISSEMLSLFGSSTGGKGGASLISKSLGLSSQNDLYIGMLKSRTTYDYIIDKFGLMELYKTKYREVARKRLGTSVLIKNGKDDIISVSVENKNPKMAADMANAFIEKLKDMTQTFAVTEASKRRLFFEEQLKKVKEDLLKSEEEMKSFEEKTGALEIGTQAKAIIESIADLRAQIAAKEVELKVMKTYSEPKNPDLQKSEEVLTGLKEQLGKLQSKNGENPDTLMPAGKMPEIGTGYTRKLREVKFNQALFDLIAQQYEIARVDEARDAIIIQVLDKAVPPEKKSKPKRALIVIDVTFMVFFLMTIAAFLSEFLKNYLNDPRNKVTIEQVKRYSIFKAKNKTSYYQKD
jgi:tyrosine-protein kinase Etk/Wzc